MATPRNRLIEVPNPDVPTARLKYRKQDGWNGDRKSLYPYSSVFEVVKGVCTNPITGVKTAYDAGNAPGSFQLPNHKLQSAYNQAYGVYQYRARGVTAQLGATMGEYSQSSTMIKNRATALFYSTRDLLTKWKKLKASKRVNPLRGRTHQAKVFGDYWLEYSFGWAPMLGDIYKAYKTMLEPLPEKPSKGTGGSSHSTSVGSNPKHVSVYDYKVSVFGTLVVTNPNLYLASNMGLTNPAAIAWELVKWSFVVDWLTDMGGYINSWDDSFGCEIRNGGISQIQTGSKTMTWTALLGTSKSTSIVSKRSAGISLPLPNLDVPKNIGDSLKRAANALALTAQMVAKGEYPSAPKIKRFGR